MIEAEVVKFNFEGKEVRTEVINEKPYFCALDVCKILEYKNGRDTIEKNCKKDGVATGYIIDRLGREQEATFIDEPNLYRLIMKSKMPKALDFQDWVCEKVIPEIRKTGQYNANQNLMPKNYKEAMQGMRIMIDKVIEIEEEKEKLQIENKQKEQTIEKISNIQNTYSFRETAKRLLIKESNLKDYLKLKHWIQYLSDGEDEGKCKIYSTSYSKDHNFALDKAVLHKKTNTFYHQFRVTEKGLNFLIKNRDKICQI